jgi:hypothetical protein
MKITIEIRDEDCEALRKLATAKWGEILNECRGPVRTVVEYAAACLAEGARRPGSWEAAAVVALFGE